MLLSKNICSTDYNLSIIAQQQKLDPCTFALAVLLNDGLTVPTETVKNMIFCYFGKLRLNYYAVILIVLCVF